MARETLKPALRFTLAASVVMACGEIAGLQDPKDTPALTADGGGPPVEGPAPADDVLIEPQSIDIGAVACGTTSSAVKNIVIKNRGPTTPKYSVQVPEGSGFELIGPREGQLAKDAMVTIGVVAKPTVSGEIAGEVAVSAGTTVAQVAVKAVGEGARLEFAPSLANLGAVRRDNGGTLDVALTNTGNKAATITKVDSSSAEFSATWDGHPAALAIEPGTTKTLKVAMKSGGDSDVLDATLSFTATGAVCGTGPVLPVEGQRVNQDVTISTADFGKQSCTTTPALQRDVVISNYTSSTLTYTAALAKGAASLFTIASGASDTIAPGTSGTPTTKAVKLAMKTVPGTLGVQSENVDIVINGIAAPSGGPRTAVATADIRGVIFAINPNNMTNFYEGEQRAVTFSNTGNEPWYLGSSFIREPNTVNEGAWIGNFGSLNPGATRVGSVRFDPYYYYRGNYAGSWTFTNLGGVPFCNGTPKLRVQGYND